MVRALETVTCHVQSQPSGDGEVHMVYDMMDKSGSFSETCGSSV